jgi:hypothetical protein
MNYSWLRYLLLLVALGLAYPLHALQDPCDELNGLIAALPSGTGGYIDATAFSGAQYCYVTLSIDRPVRIQFGNALWYFYGRPGILWSTYGPVILQGNGWEYSATPAGWIGTVLMSATDAPLILDQFGSWGSQLINIDLNGNSHLGTFGFLGPRTGGMNWSQVHIQNFAYAGIVNLQGRSSYHDLFITYNGGDGAVIGGDSTMDGDTQISGNGGVGLHVIAGGLRATDVDSDDNALHGIFLDGREPADWKPLATYVVSTLSKPTVGNPCECYFLSVNVNGTTAGVTPNWPQTPGSTVLDGSVVWLNTGTHPGLTLSANVNFISGGYIDDNGFGEPSGFVSDNIRIEGANLSDMTASFNHVDGTHVAQGAVTTYPAIGLHIINSSQTEVTGVNWLGGAWNTARHYEDAGIVIENSNGVVVSNFTAMATDGNPLRIQGSNNTIVQGVRATETGIASTSRSGSYCIFIDDRSTHTTLSNINCTSSTGFGRGIYNIGKNTMLSGYSNSTSAIPADYLGDLASFIDAQGNGSFSSVQSSEETTSQLTVNGAGLLQTLSAQSASIAGEIDAASIRINGTLIVPTAPLTFWTLPVLGTTGVTFPRGPNVALRTAFEIPSGGVSFNTISVIVITADPSPSNHYGVQISDVSGQLLCSMKAGKPLTVIGRADFQCKEGLVNLTQGIYTLVLSSNLVAPGASSARYVRADRGQRSRLREQFASSTVALLGVVSQFPTSYFSDVESISAADGAAIGPISPVSLNAAILGDIPVLQLHQ